MIPRRAVAAGADVVVAQGTEAGGHVAGEVSTMALVPRVVDAVAPVPVVASGGIADGWGLVAALALGAEAVAMGTRFLATPEANAHSRSPCFPEMPVRKQVSECPRAPKGARASMDDPSLGPDSRRLRMRPYRGVVDLHPGRISWPACRAFHSYSQAATY